jgi:hypothetical protein
MTELDRADREPALVTEARVEHIKQKVATVMKQMRELKQIGKQMAQVLSRPRPEAAFGDRQLSGN